jgi:hypothetical protein
LLRGDDSSQHTWIARSKERTEASQRSELEKGKKVGVQKTIKQRSRDLVVDKSSEDIEERGERERERVGRGVHESREIG